MPKQDGNPFDWNATQEQFNSECVSETVWMSVLDPNQLEQLAIR
jgi:hypothetical protein